MLALPVYLDRLLPLVIVLVSAAEHLVDHLHALVIAILLRRLVRQRKHAFTLAESVRPARDSHRQRGA